MSFTDNNIDNKGNDFTSKFNEAKLQLMRLNISWIRSSNYASSGNLRSWKWELDCIWRELSADAGNKDPEQLNKLNMKIALAEKRNNNALVYKCLEEKQIFLRNIQEKSGKGSSKSHSDDDSFD